MKGAFKENHGCIVSLILIILVVSLVATTTNKNKEIKLLNTKIEIKDEVIKNLEDKAEAESKESKKPQLPAYVYLDREHCIHMLSTCSHIQPEKRDPIIKNNYDEVIINMPTPSHNYALKRLKISETDFSKYEWYCSECIVDGYYELLITGGYKKPSPTATSPKSEEKPQAKKDKAYYDQYKSN